MTHTRSTRQVVTPFIRIVGSVLFRLAEPLSAAVERFEQDNTAIISIWATARLHNVDLKYTIRTWPSF